MTGAVSYKDGIGRKELQTIRRRFAGVQKERLHRINAEFRPSQRIFLELLPLLFHINHPMLPGFISTDTPMGIPDYNPTQAVLRTARKLSRSFSYKKRAKRRFAVQGLYLMGSIGSVAHTLGSDLDIWLCYDPELAPRELEKLREKTRKLEEWAAELGLETHFFLMNVARFRKGRLDRLSHESSGTTQPHLLLEEFYRSGVLLAGRYPVWWLVPPEEEANYSGYVEMLFHKRFVDPLDVLDFGGLESLPAGEFLGAAHWQLYKGIESPYKTILKLLLTEAYARDYPNIRWLCQEMKSAIYEGDIDMGELDPYVLMYRRVEHYLDSRDETKRLMLARRCFYFKTEQRLSKSRQQRAKDWKQELLFSLVGEWKWEDSDLLNLDSRDHWKIDHVMEERNTLVRELTHSYRLLTDFAREFATGDTIDPEELSLLGRKLYTALERRPGKIDSINPGIARSLVEKQVSLHYAKTRDEGRAWFLFLGSVDPEMARISRPLKTTQTLLEMLTWCHHNRVIDRSTIVSLHPRDNPVGKEELQALLNTLHSLYPAHETIEVPMSQLAAQPYLLSSALFINTGRDPMAHLAREGKQLTSNRSDPLSFGARHSSLVETLEQVTTTSWGETLVISHEGTDGLLNSLCHYLRLTLLSGTRATPPRCSAHSFSCLRGTSTARRVEQLFNDVCLVFSVDGLGLDGRYLLQIGDEFFILHRKQEQFSYFSIDDREELMEVLAQPSTEFRPLAMDPYALPDTPLPAIYQANRADTIQVFYYKGKGETDLYVLDDNGALFHQKVPGTDEHYLLVQQQRFLNGLSLLKSLLAEEPSYRMLLDAPEFYSLVRSQDGPFLAEPRTPPRHRLPDSFMELRLITDRMDLQHSPYLLACGDREFSSIEHGEQIYSSVAEYILGRRKGHETYPIYLTSVELSGIASDNNLTTIDLLNYKKRLENRLNEALGELTRHASPTSPPTP